MKTALTIAGSDSSGGAGIQADIKTMLTNGVYSMSAITAITAQNTTGVTDIMEVTPKLLRAQLDAVFTDIYPDAVKIGMVSSSALIDVIADTLAFYHAKNIVVDPVMVATSGARLVNDEAVRCLKKKLLPIATLVTPNIPEGEVLSGHKIETQDDMEVAAKEISSQYHCSVLLKGGHSKDHANDILCEAGRITVFSGKRIDNQNTHGTGCTLSSAIAAGLARGLTVTQAVDTAKKYVTKALSAMLDLGKGNGPMNHGFMLNCQ